MLDHELAELRVLWSDEVKRLRSIVATLPKCWRLVDGKPVQDCPVVLGMKAWLKAWTAKAGGASAYPVTIDRIEVGGFIRAAFDRWGDYRNVVEHELANSSECAEVLAEKDGET